ncbi:MAG: glycosyltransferase 87 family protein [Agriterribacter sp.]
MGARFQKDGYIPYDYKWKKGDERKYFDSEGDYSVEINGITATPFLHMLLYPLTGFSIKSIFKIWTAFQYIMLLCMGIICYRFAYTSVQRKLVVVGCVLFLFTEAWVNAIATGQLYLLIPFLFGCFLFCLLQKNGFYSFAMGLLAISLVLIRPNAIFIFLPFLWLLKTAKNRQVVFFVIAPGLLILWIVLDQQQRNLWLSYKSAVSTHVKMHQGEGPQRIDNVPFEHQENTNDARLSDDRIFYSENGNLFVVVKRIIGVKLSTSFLVVATFAVIIILCAAFMKNRFDDGYLLYIYGIFGTCLYMISDLLSPIHRHQYYTVQWFFALLLSAAIFRKEFKAIYICLGIGLLLNIINTPLIKMEHTIGEYLWLIALLFLSYMYKPAFSRKVLSN